MARNNIEAVPQLRKPVQTRFGRDAITLICYRIGLRLRMHILVYIYKFDNSDDDQPILTCLTLSLFVAYHLKFRLYELCGTPIAAGNFQIVRCK